MAILGISGYKTKLGLDNASGLFKSSSGLDESLSTLSGLGNTTNNVASSGLSKIGGIQGLGTIIGAGGDLLNAGLSIYNSIASNKRADEQLALAKDQYATENARYNEWNENRKAVLSSLDSAFASAKNNANSQVKTEIKT